MTVIVVSVASADTRKVPASSLPTCGSSSTRLAPCLTTGGTDFTADANALGCWLLFTDGTETGAEADNCAAGGTDNMTYTGSTFAVGATEPAGTPATQDSASFDGTGDYFALADQDEFEAAQFTIGCWVYPEDATANEFIFSKEDVANWEIRLNSTTSYRGEVANAAETSAPSSGNDTWEHVVMRYATATQEVEFFFDGLDGCNPPCVSATTAPSGNSADMVLGATESKAGEFTGDLMECFYFDRPLTDTEICEVMLCGLDGTADGSARETAFGASGCQCSDISTCC